MRISEAGLNLIKSFEALRLKAYMPTIHDVPTIGYGHTRGVQMGDECTEEEADQYLRDDLADAEATVNHYVEPDITQNQFDALTSLVFNIGAGNFRSSTLLRLLNAGNLDGAAKQFGVWVRQAHVTLAGLTRRRSAERELFNA